jgi:hypothetical protein
MSKTIFERDAGSTGRGDWKGSMKPGEFLEAEGRYFWVVDKPENVRDSDFGEWANCSRLELNIRAARIHRTWWRTATTFEVGSGNRKLLFLREFDPLTFAMMKALERSKHHERA